MTLQAGRGELLQRLSSKLKEWAPLLQRFLKSQDEQARATAAHVHCASACLYVVKDVEEGNRAQIRVPQLAVSDIASGFPCLDCPMFSCGVTAKSAASYMAYEPTSCIIAAQLYLALSCICDGPAS